MNVTTLTNPPIPAAATSPCVLLIVTVLALVGCKTDPLEIAFNQRLQEARAHVLTSHASELTADDRRTINGDPQLMAFLATLDIPGKWSGYWAWIISGDRALLINYSGLVMHPFEPSQAEIRFEMPSR